MEAIELIEWLWRGMLFLLAFVLLSAGLFMLEGDQEKVQSRLEQLWQRMRDEVHQHAMSFMLAFVQQTARVTHKGFSILFGDLLSARFFIVSGLLSTLSFMLGLWLLGGYGWAIPSAIVIFAIGTAWLAFIGKRVSDDTTALMEKRNDQLARMLSTLDEPEEPVSDSRLQIPAFDRLQRGVPALRGKYDYDLVAGPARPWWEEAFETLNRELPLYIPAIVLTSTGSLVFKEALDRGVNGWVFGVAIAASFICDVVAIGFTMYVLEKVAAVKNWLLSAVWLVADAAVAAAMAVIPWFLFMQFGGGDRPFTLLLLFIAVANLSTALPAIFYFLIAVLMLLHRVFWTILLRPFYIFFINSKVLKNRAVLMAAGLSLLTLGWPGMGDRVGPWVGGLLTLL